MFDVAEAGRLLAELPKDNVFGELAEITAWLDTLKDARGFRPGLRAEIIMLLDETGQALYRELLQLYLGAPHLQDFKGAHLWQGLHGFMKTLAEAYSVCTGEYQQAEKKSADFTKTMPVICVRRLRAVAEQMKLELMHYLDVDQSVWERLCSCYNFAVAGQFADSMRLSGTGDPYQPAARVVAGAGQGGLKGIQSGNEFQFLRIRLHTGDLIARQQQLLCECHDVDGNRRVCAGHDP